MRPIKDLQYKWREAQDFLVPKALKYRPYISPFWKIFRTEIRKIEKVKRWYRKLVFVNGTPLLVQFWTDRSKIDHILNFYTKSGTLRIHPELEPIKAFKMSEEFSKSKFLKFDAGTGHGAS